MNDIHPMAAYLMELEMSKVITDFGKQFFRNPANCAEFEAWRAAREIGVSGHQTI